VNIKSPVREMMMTVMMMEQILEKLHSKMKTRGEPVVK